MNNSPIIFCHYGNSNYLEYSLYLAKNSNPQKKIYLLGDLSNLKVAKKVGVIHIEFKQFDFTNSVIDFNNNFKFIAGANHGRKDWTKFVFLRWFYINEFILRNKIDSFWHFDSDNFIFSDLFEKEIYFKNYDNTEQCGGICLNGFISSSSIIHMYTKHILFLFSNDDYLRIQINKCISNVDFAFTEMAAYNDFKKSFKLNSIRLNIIDFGETFDDCLAFPDGMEQSSESYNGHHIKEIYLNRNNQLYFNNKFSKVFIKVNSINVSWLPFPIILRIFHISLRQRLKILRYFNIDRKHEYSKVDFSKYSILEKIIDKLIFIILKYKY